MRAHTHTCELAHVHTGGGGVVVVGERRPRHGRVSLSPDGGKSPRACKQGEILEEKEWKYGGAWLVSESGIVAAMRDGGDLGLDGDHGNREKWLLKCCVASGESPSLSDIVSEHGRRSQA